MNVKFRATFGAAILSAAAIAVGLLSAPASADPSPITDYRQLAGVGSDTTQDVMNDLANGTSVVGADGNRIIASWDSTGTSPISIKDPATRPLCTMDRPHGNDIDALRNDILAGRSCIDFVRMSRGPLASGTELTWIPFARDAVTWTTDLTSPIGAQPPGNLASPSLTISQLRSIYTTCSYTDAAGVQRPVQPLLPPFGSGPRQSWLLALGLSEDDVRLARASGVCAGYKDTDLGNDGTAITNLNQIMPYSVAQWIAQGKSLPGVPNRRGESRLRAVSNQAPITGSGPATTLNSSFVFSHDVYNVIQTTRLNTSPILATFVGAGAKVCSPASIAVIKNYGFGDLNADLALSNCGDTNLTGWR
ncbi:hypothetical protein ABZ883_35680 [Streptomyces sp. NPDC046977]|uniref:hypothetical protein n=1 Tax=Streptomyces sp. NPDC046977 TaxID=3154703 RepID=UPI0033C1BB0C